MTATEKELAELRKQMKATRWVLATFIAWSVRELGDQGVRQLLKMLEDNVSHDDREDDEE